MVEKRQLPDKYKQLIVDSVRFLVEDQRVKKVVEQKLTYLHNNPLQAARNLASHPGGTGIRRTDSTIANTMTLVF
ncbi:hypothetical protein GCM10027275_18600 [Rhabdobacter roseus]|uniref:Uncharacterized protein n=1 Tax=Rhabdobacter roseus TaxID=1655419 RepID=A0A840TRC1_9BACT|nr:hypothetical protein [Rhabdobacter roseus]